MWQWKIISEYLNVEDVHSLRQVQKMGKDLNMSFYKGHIFVFFCDDKEWQREFWQIIHIDRREIYLQQINSFRSFAESTDRFQEYWITHSITPLSDTKIQINPIQDILQYLRNGRCCLWKNKPYKVRNPDYVE